MNYQQFVILFAALVALVAIGGAMAKPPCLRETDTKECDICCKYEGYDGGNTKFQGRCLCNGTDKSFFKNIFTAKNH